MRVGRHTPCVLGQYWEARSVEELANFCRHACGPTAMCGPSKRQRQPEAFATFWANCRRYAHVDYDAELPDMIRDTRRLPHAECARSAASDPHEISAGPRLTLPSPLTRTQARPARQHDVQPSPSPTSDLWTPECDRDLRLGSRNESSILPRRSRRLPVDA